MLDLISHYFSVYCLFGRYRALLIRVLLVVAMAITPASILAQTYITNGIGAYTEFNENTLLIKLELEAPATDALEVMAMNTYKKLSFRLMKDRSPRAWSKIWIQNLSINNSPDTLTTQTTDLIAMTQAIEGGLRAGDLIEFERTAADLTIMSINGQEISNFETPAFFEFLLTAFVGSIPPSSELKNQLLAGIKISYENAILFDSLSFTEQRAMQIASWNIPAELVTADIDTSEPSSMAPSSPLGVADETESTRVTEDEMLLFLAYEDDTAELGMEEQTNPIESELLTGAEVVEEQEEAPIVITAESLLAAQNYQRSVLQSVYGELQYPLHALRRNREGSLRLAMAINSNGSVSSIEVIENAEYDLFEDAAIEAIEEASPFDPLPISTLEVPMVLEIPISFRLQ